MGWQPWSTWKKHSVTADPQISFEATALLVSPVKHYTPLQQALELLAGLSPLQKYAWEHIHA